MVAPYPASMDDTESYALSRLNGSTYLVVQNDKYMEFPYIYIKIVGELSLVIVIDTGCGAQSTKGSRGPADLKDFIEKHILTEVQSSESGDRNRAGWEYMIICTHCHFDHIGGIEPFARLGTTSIVASAYDKNFISEEDLPSNSFCTAFDTATPKYSVTCFALDQGCIKHKGIDVGMRTLHTPGHTPDSMAIYDEKERWVFTGDTCYRRIADMPWNERQDVPILFPAQGNWRDYKSSLKKLIHFVRQQEEQVPTEAQDRRVMIGCGHTTAGIPAGAFLKAALNFSKRIEEGKVPVLAKLSGDQVAPGGSLGEDAFVLWQDDGDPEFSMCAPETFNMTT